ncbi:hypothetical protein RB595_007500 [Gaeumannomyces hyphopodioides]
MDKVPFLRAKSDSVSSTSTIVSFTGFKVEPKWLPAPVQERQTIRLRTLLGHCHYRRVILWTLAISGLLGWALVMKPRDTAASLSWLDFRNGKEPEKEDGEREPLPWLKYAHLDSYFNAGLKAIVPFSEHKPEFPFQAGQERPTTTTLRLGPIPHPTPYVPQPDYESAEYLEKNHAVKRCYLDKEQKIPVPDTLAYAGVPQGLPDPAIGSYDLLGLRSDVCFDRFGRYGPYGLGYDGAEGGTSEGTDTEREGSEAVWARTGKVDYRAVDWGAAQKRCLVANRDRFENVHDVAAVPDDDGGDEQRPGEARGRGKMHRIAVVVRIYVGFEWTQHVVLNFRAMVSELALKSGGEYTVHFLLHVKDDNVPIWADAAAAQRVLDDAVPREFHSLCTLWSEAQMRLVYPGNFGEAVENPSGSDVHGVYRSAQMPLQDFAMAHPEYEHFWNWEMDMRYLGNYYELFDRLGGWARAQSRAHLWERSAKYYLPAVHGTWANFSDLVAETTRRAGKRPIMGPVYFPGRQPIRAEERGESFLPADTCGAAGDAGDGVESIRHSDGCGRGEEADLITLNPIFDAEGSGWVFASDVTGYDRAWPTPPRRCAIVTAGRLSRRLLAVMHEETWRMRHSMFSEMFPAAMALHHGLKAAYAPHPVLLDRGWGMAHADAAFNGGYDASTSGHGSPFDFGNEHNHKGTTWYYNSEFAGLLWRRWLGYAQMDGRGDDGGRAGAGTLRGGRAEEEAPGSPGRLCLRSMLVHPIKWEKPQ